MNEIVDRAAQAICENDYHGTWFHISKDNQEGYRKLARVVLAAIFEPMEAMLDAGENAILSHPSDKMERAWKAMIEVALANDEPTS